MTITRTIRLDDDNTWRIEAVSVLKSGAIVGVPTETVYGLAGDATRDDAIAAIYAAKGRPAKNPLIVHVANLEMGERYAAFSPAARRLAKAFWPGPLTLVLPLKKHSGLANAVTAGGDSLALRCPQGPLRDLCQTLERPLAAPSANRSGHVSATSAAHVRSDLDGRITLILDGGTSQLGLESTILDLRRSPRILRPGALDKDALAGVLGTPVATADDAEDDSPVAPGQLSSHYAPSVPVRLNVLPGDVLPNEAYLGFGIHALSGHETLSKSGDVDEAAKRLYSSLRACDRPGVAGIAIAPLPQEGVGQALANRLTRAAAPRG
jgi:L-threonylcarbamoyladenylate synthase